jgi:tmRNA-binding protein
MTQEHKIKVEIGLGLGKKKYDKREAIKAKELKRGFERILKAF